ncbi:hypothetical protein BH10BDE1_BH10BDE1_14020 [soil metagenome]
MRLTISRILHAGYLFESGGARVLVDPLFETPFSRNCFAYPAVEFDVRQIRGETFDAVFISHYHDDHLSFDSLDLIDRATPIYLFCIHEEIFALLREMGFLKVYGLKLGASVSIGQKNSITITAHPALDRDVDSILEIEAGGRRVLNVVDSWIDPDVFSTLQKKSWDLVLWPFQTLRELEVLSPSAALKAPAEIPHEWLEQLGQLDAKVFVPSSCQFRFEEWSWMNRVYFPISYEFFEKNLREVAPRARVLRLNPGASIHLLDGSFEAASPIAWIKPIGPQDVDYVFDPDVVVPSTADLARKFAALTPTEVAKVAEFCASELPERYRALEVSEEGDFASALTWQLSVFDQRGQAEKYHFSVSGSRLTRIFDDEAVADWTTEVIAARLLGALQDGESLSSMYLRISDAPDLLEDPLLRVLFNGEIGSYQRAQLRRLQR